MRSIFTLLALGAGAFAAIATPYEMNYPDTQTVGTGKNRSTGSISLNGQFGMQTLTVDQSDRLLYHQLFDKPFVVMLSLIHI